MKIETLSVDFTDEQKRYLEGFATGLADQQGRARPRRRRCRQGQSRAERTGRRAYQGAGQGHRVGQEARRPGKIQARGASVRRLSAAEAAGAAQRAAVAGGQFSLALFRPVLCRAGAGLLHVPAADSERHPQALAVRRAWPISPSRYAGRSATSPPAPICRCARFQPKHAVALIEGIQDLGLCSRGSGADNIRNVTGTPTAGIDPQELLDTRAIRPRMALSHSQRPLADGIAAQIQRRLRRRRQDRGARRHQRYRLCRRRGEGRFRRRARHLVSSRHRRHHRAQGFCQGNRHHRQAGGRDQSCRRHRPRVHRHRRPHQPAQGAAEIRHRRHGHGEIPGPGRGEARPRLDPRAAGSAGAAPGVRPHGPYRRAQAEAGRPELDRGRAAARQDDLRADARAGQNRAAISATAKSG